MWKGNNVGVWKGTVLPTRATTYAQGFTQNTACIRLSRLGVKKAAVYEAEDIKGGGKVQGYI